jgi:hypothetical protein
MGEVEKIRGRGAEGPRGQGVKGKKLKRKVQGFQGKQKRK